MLSKSLSFWDAHCAAVTLKPLAGEATDYFYRQEVLTFMWREKKNEKRAEGAYQVLKFPIIAT